MSGYSWNLEWTPRKKHITYSEEEEEEEEEGVVGFEGEPISALIELKNGRRKNKQLKDLLQCVEEGMYNSNNEEYAYQKEKLEEAIKSEESLAP